MNQAERTREQRLRRMAERQGLALKKSPRRDPYALDFGTYILVDPDTNALVLGGPSGGFAHAPDLDDIEAYLKGDR